ncbi:mannitol 2-dehydrogenase [Tranquillimonas rosea]|uniref:Mannitol 2-dehydrogenase n=1 Tax=Tranquillimonas rosea TaxID=641238 RepID=A0A1H9Q6F3_9RHOB|nr:mannitol dehydrogenase family protein [Tranquillimonas rosea]SER55695.1 mannitol 2-dehydrogenase [Tranquillimonas rosea]
MTEALSAATLGSLPQEVARPGYDRSSLKPGILHVGVGNFHRAHQAVYLDRLFASGRDHDWGLVGAGVREGDARMRDRLAAQDWLYTVVELDPAGLSARVVGTIADFVPVEPEANIARMADPEIRIVSLTVTEGGYYIDADTGGFDEAHPDIQADLSGHSRPKTVFGQICAALTRRFEAGVQPFTVMSCDNIPSNGDATKQAVLGYARLCDPDLALRIEAEVAFPNGMVDCITPATSPRELAMVRDQFGIEDAAPVVCEPFRQWVLEDHFPAGRPALEEVGVEFVEDVLPYELMKLRILNGGHAAIAYPSALLGHELADQGMADPDVAAWLHALETRELMPTLEPIPGVDYGAYRDKVAERFANAKVGDTIARLCLDGSNRQPKFILPAVREALRDSKRFDGLALEVALWCTYCRGQDEAGRDIHLDDPRAEQLRAAAQASKTDAGAFLRQGDIFGTLGEDRRFADAFADALSRIERDGVRDTLRAYVQGG